MIVSYPAYIVQNADEDMAYLSFRDIPEALVELNPDISKNHLYEVSEKALLAVLKLFYPDSVPLASLPLYGEFCVDIEYLHYTQEEDVPSEQTI